MFAPSHVTRAARTAILAAIVLVTLASSAAAQSVTLAWDANTETNLAGYIVEYGPQVGNPSTSINGRQCDEPADHRPAGRRRRITSACGRSTPSGQQSVPSNAGLPYAPRARRHRPRHLPAAAARGHGRRRAAGSMGDPVRHQSDVCVRCQRRVRRSRRRRRVEPRRVSGEHAPRGFHRRFFAEGANNSFFSTRFAIANPQTSDARVLLTFVDSTGQTRSGSSRLPRARGERGSGRSSRAAGASFSTCSRASADRARSADDLGRHTPAHAETALSAPANRGSRRRRHPRSFELFYLLQNASTATADVQVRYLRPAGVAPIVKHYSVPARSRFTIWVDQEDTARQQPTCRPRSLRRQRADHRRAIDVSEHAGPRLQGRAQQRRRDGGLDELVSRRGRHGRLLFDVRADRQPVERRRRACARPTSVTPARRSSRRTRCRPTAGSRSTSRTKHRSSRATSTAVQVQSTNAVPIIVERTMWWHGAARRLDGGSQCVRHTFDRTALGACGGRGGRSPRRDELRARGEQLDGHGVTCGSTLLYEDGAEESATISIGASRRSTVDIGAAFPNAVGRRFSALVESLNPAEASALVVERAMYWSTGPDFWGVGSDAVGTRLP